MNILVVGSTGFIGRALVSRLLAEGHTVEAWSRSGDSPTSGSLHSLEVDLLDPRPLPRPWGQRWDAAYLLAAHAAPNTPWTRERILENVAMTARTLDHLAVHAEGCRTIFASSAYVYAPSPFPLRETDLVAPMHPYGLSKQLSENWAQSKRDVLHIHIVRPFNQIGPGMPKGLLLPDLLERLSSQEPILRMRGKDDRKDFLDWRDAMDAYIALLEVDAPSGSIWNLCSGRTVSVSSLIMEMLDLLGERRELSFANPSVESLVGDPSRLMAAARWSPHRALRETLESIISARC